MSTAHPADEAAIREQAYYFWEQDGRPGGRESEYWHRAMVAVTEKAQLDMLTKPAPRKAAKPKAKAEPVKLKAETRPKAAPKLRAAASKAKAIPAKSAKPDADKKPKKK